MGLPFLLIICFCLSALPAWCALNFPSPDQVRADFPDRTEQAAAFVILLTMANHGGYPESIAQPYNLALAQIDPPWKPEHPHFSDTYYALSETKEFRLRIADKYMPEFAGKVRGELENQRVDRDVDRTTALAFIALIVVPLICTFLRGRSPRLRPAMPEHAAASLGLAGGLWRVRLPGRSYSAFFDGGRVDNVKIWEDVDVRTSTIPGRTYTVGDTTYTEAPTTSTRVVKTMMHRYTLQTPDGRKVDYTFANPASTASVGDIFGCIIADGEPVLACNYTRGGAVTEVGSGVWNLHGQSGVFNWGVTAVTITAIIWGLEYPIMTSPGKQAHPYAYIALLDRWAVFIVIFLTLYILLLKLVLPISRSLIFRLFYKPSMRAFLLKSGPALTGAFRIAR